LCDIPPANQTNAPNPENKEEDKEPKKYVPNKTSSRFGWVIPVLIAILAVNIAIIMLVAFHQAGVLQSALEKFLQQEGQFKHALEKALQIPVVLQIASLSSLVWFVRCGLEPALRYLHRNVSRRSLSWEKTRLAWLFRDVYGPLEILLILASFCRFLDGLVAPYLLHLPAGLVERFTTPVLQMALIVASTRVLMNWRTRLFAEWYFQLEMGAKKEPKKRIETLEKIINVVMVVVAAGLSLQAWGLDIQSLFTVGGLSGVALALAGRDVMQNLFAGGMILATDPFSEGEEISFYYSGSQVRPQVSLERGPRGLAVSQNSAQLSVAFEFFLASFVFVFPQLEHKNLRFLTLRSYLSLFYSSTECFLRQRFLTV
jgi:cell division protein FtsL